MWIASGHCDERVSAPTTLTMRHGRDSEVRQCQSADALPGDGGTDSAKRAPKYDVSEKCVGGLAIHILEPEVYFALRAVD